MLNLLTNKEIDNIIDILNKKCLNMPVSDLDIKFVEGRIKYFYVYSFARSIHCCFEPFKGAHRYTVKLTDSEFSKIIYRFGKQISFYDKIIALMLGGK